MRLVLQLNIGGIAISLSPPENLQRMYCPFQQFRQDLGRLLYYLGRAIFLCTDDGWRCSTDLVALFDIHRIAIRIADIAVDAQHQRLDGQFLLFLISRQAWESLHINHTGQSFDFGPVVVGSIFQPL